jgi:hypothetical protein
VLPTGPCLARYAAGGIPSRFRRLCRPLHPHRLPSLTEHSLSATNQQQGEPPDKEEEDESEYVQRPTRLTLAVPSETLYRGIVPSAWASTPRSTTSTLHRVSMRSRSSRQNLISPESPSSTTAYAGPLSLSSAFVRPQGSIDSSFASSGPRSSGPCAPGGSTGGSQLPGSSFRRHATASQWGMQPAVFSRASEGYPLRQRSMSNPGTVVFVPQPPSAERPPPCRGPSRLGKVRIRCAAEHMGSMASCCTVADLLRRA